MNPNKPKHSLKILFSVIALDLIGFGVVIPILPFYAEAYGANATTLGILLTCYAAMQFLFAPIWGKLSDKFGRKSVLLWTMAGSIVGLVIVGTAQGLVQLFVGRIISGIFAANLSVASAYVTDVTDEENRAKGMGMIGAAFGIGFILGPALGGLLSGHGYGLPILAAAGLGILNLIYATLKLQEPPRAILDEPQISRGQVLSNPAIRKMCLLNLLFTLGVTQLESIFAFFMMDRFGYDARHVAYIYVMMAFIMVSIQGGMIKRLVTQFGEKNLLLGGALLLTLALSLVPGMPRIGILLLPLALASIGRGISQPAMLSLVSKYSPVSLRGASMGVFQSSASFARILGPLIAGWLYDRGIGLPFYFASVMLGGVFLVAMVPARRAQATVEV